MRPLDRLAALLNPITAETAFGGRSIHYEPLGALWLSILSSASSEDSGAPSAPVRRLKLEAETWSDPRLEPGLVVEMEGLRWRLVHLVADSPRIGRMTLSLEAERP